MPSHISTQKIAKNPTMLFSYSSFEGELKQSICSSWHTDKKVSALRLRWKSFSLAGAQLLRLKVNMVVEFESKVFQSQRLGNESLKYHISSPRVLLFDVAFKR
jgi:hypothetical protein